VIEGTMFMMMIATYLYLKVTNLDWPPTTVPNPDLVSSTAVVVILVVSAFVMMIADRGALRANVNAVRVGYGLCIVAGISVLVLRSIAMSTLGYKWSSHAYGSVVWVSIGLHTFHQISATAEVGLLFVYSFVRPITKKQLLDIRTTAVYWYFVVLMWLPFYFTIYVAPYFSRK